jgi:hypothetical protein
MKKHASFVLLTTAFGLFSAHAGVDCIALSLSVKHAAAMEQSRVLEIVSKEVSAAPTCACEIVKAAIEGSAANSKTVAAIVQAASIAAPDQMRLVSQCAVAVAPDALTEVQAVLALMDPNLGDSGSSAKSAKGEKAAAGEVASIPNPLDFPGQGPIGPTPGSPGGLGIFPFSPPPGTGGTGGIVFVPQPGSVAVVPPGAGGDNKPPVIPPVVTNPNPPVTPPGPPFTPPGPPETPPGLPETPPGLPETPSVPTDLLNSIRG